MSVPTLADQTSREIGPHGPPGFLTSRAAKLLAHPEALRSFAREGRLTPITVQLAPTELCESRCTFCSYGNRDSASALHFGDIEAALHSFRELGALGLELTGGGNPLLYKCRKTGRNIRDVIGLASESFDTIGMITNGIDLSRIGRSQAKALSWVRISGVKFFEGKSPADIDLGFVSPDRVSFNFVCPSGTISARAPASEVHLDALSHLIGEILMRYPMIRFVRVVPDFNRVISGDRFTQERRVLRRLLDISDKVFVDGFGDKDFARPESSGCLIGGFKPFVASSPDYDDSGAIYMCCCYSHFTNRRYDWKYVLCRIPDIVEQWKAMQHRMVETGVPYSMASPSPEFCLHARNNRILDLARSIGDRFIDANAAPQAVEDAGTL